MRKLFIISMLLIFAWGGVNLNANESKSLFIHGLVKQCTAVPDPKKLDYPNCLYTAEIEVYAIQDNATETISENIVLTIPIVRNRVLDVNNKLVSGDKISFSCVLYDDAPQNIREMQVADDLNLLDYENYFAEKFSKVDKLPDKSGELKKVTIRIEPIAINSFDRKATELRAERIASEIVYCERLLKEHGYSYLHWKRDYQKKYKDYVAQWKDKKIWKNNCLFAYSTGHFNDGRCETFLKGILAYKQFFTERNIDLILLRIPSKGDFNEACLISPDKFEPSPDWMEFYHTCLLNDIEVIDPLPLMWKKRYEYPLFYFNHIDSEGHPFEGTSKCSAELLANVLMRYVGSASWFEKLFSFTQRENKKYLIYQTAYSGTAKREFWPSGNDKFNSKQHMTFSAVKYVEGTVPVFTKDTESPILILSNSFGAYPSKALGASIPHYTAQLLNIDIAWFYQDGTGNSMMRNILKYQEALRNKKCVIMIMHPNEWGKSMPPLPEYYKTDKTIELILSDVYQAQGLMSLVNSADKSLFKINDKGFFVPAPLKDRLGGKLQLNFPKEKNKLLRFYFKQHSYISMQVLNGAEVLDECGKPPDKNDCLDLNVPAGVANIDILFESIFPNDKPEITKLEVYTY